MEISSRMLREVEFRDRLRGYDTDEVDEFLEKVAVGVDELHTSLAEARDQLEKASQRASAEDEANYPDDAAIRRTLVLAQRTADLAIMEAEAEAQRSLEEARTRADALVANAEEEVQRSRAAAEVELRTHVEDLETRRARLEREVAALAELLGQERARLGDALSSALRLVNDTLNVSDELRTKANALAPLRPVESDPASPPPAEQATEAGRPRFDFAADLATDIDDDLEPPAPIAITPERGAPEESGFAAEAPLAFGASSWGAISGSDDEEELWERWAKGSPLDAGELPGRASDEQRRGGDRAS